MNFVVVGRDVGSREATLAIGPFDTDRGADEFRALLERASSGVYIVVPLFAPTSNHPDARRARGLDS